MSLFVELDDNGQSTKGTGVVIQKNLGKDAILYRTEEDFSFDSLDAIKTKAAWDAAILAGNIQPLGKIAEIEPQNVEATNYESPVNNFREELTPAKRITQYRFLQSIYNHSALKSYSDINCRFFILTDKNILRGSLREDLKPRGFKTSQFNVGILDTQTESALPFSRLTIAWDDADEWDENPLAFEPEFDIDLLEGAYDVGFNLQSAASAGGTLTLTFDAVGPNGVSQIDTLLQADLKLVDNEGSTVTIDSFSVDGSKANRFTVTATTDITRGRISIDGIIEKTSILYSSNGVSFTV